MNIAIDATPPSSVIVRLRAATEDIHRRLEQRLDILARLSDPARRLDMIRRFCALHVPAEATLGAWLVAVPGLDFRGRCRTPLLASFGGATALPAFPAPESRAEALGMLYVLEGSTLGGRLILRTLEDRGVDDPRLVFLDPYGTGTGTRWRSFLSVLARETARDKALIAQACRGAVSGFHHAERVLCGEPA